MGLPFFESLGMALRGKSVLLHYSFTELEVFQNGESHQGVIEVLQKPYGFKVSFEVFNGYESNVVSQIVDSQELTELADMFSEAADIAKALEPRERD